MFQMGLNFTMDVSFLSHNKGLRQMLRLVVFSLVDFWKTCGPCWLAERSEETVNKTGLSTIVNHGKHERSFSIQS